MTHYVYVTGPECSGKTTLAKSLATALDIPLVPEFSRAYLTVLYQSYSQQDVVQIAKTQRTMQESYRALQAPTVICDTGPLVLKIWAEVVWHEVPEEIEGYLSDCVGILLLCKPEMEWQPDPLRENQHNRAELYERYLTAAKTLNWPYLEVEGDLNKRCSECCSFIKESIPL
ncbi:MAG: ATP-binding protein [Saprospiraceae bacterium]|nr:ATP-binding protein [Saprospiraceae bacterium]